MTVLYFTYRKTGEELVRKSQILEVELALVDLLERTRRGEIVGMWYVVDHGDGNHCFSLDGSYNQTPSSAFAPACKSLHELSLIIDEAGQSGCI